MEGPEFKQDFTYYLVDKMPDLRNFERGIPLQLFENSMVTKRIELEFRTLQKMCFHKDHVLNLFTSFDIQFHKINRYKDILPFLHNRVILQENPILSTPTGVGAEGGSDDCNSENFSGSKNKLLDNLIDIHGSDSRLQTYFNASYINSMIKSKQQAGSSYIASSSPGLKTTNSRLSDDDDDDNNDDLTTLAKKPETKSDEKEAPEQQEEPTTTTTTKQEQPQQLKPKKSIGPNPSFANFW